jgi:hypothetical protein
MYLSKKKKKKTNNNKSYVSFLFLKNLKKNKKKLIFNLGAKEVRGGGGVGWINGALKRLLLNINKKNI